MQKNIINIGIFAHVDAGKTSTTENLLFKAGKIRTLGNVDQGTTHNDFLAIEKERGISVKSSISTLEWKDYTINIIDTPGHTDFAFDVEKSLSVIDGAILVVSAVEGIQGHTETIWNALKKLDIPTFIFINKIDRIGADIDALLQQIEKTFTSNYISLQKIENEGLDAVAIFDELENPSTEFLEKIVSFNDDLMEQYFDGNTISKENLEEELKTNTRNKNLLPILLGSAKLQMGIENILDAVIQYLPLNKEKNEALSAQIFKISHHKDLGKICFARIFSGSIKNRSVLKNISQNIEEKVGQLKINSGAKFENSQEAFTNEIVAICGFEQAKIGDYLGSKPLHHQENIELNKPLLTVQVKPKEEKDFPKLVAALTKLSSEDTTLDLEWLKEEKELHIKILGKMQIEILQNILEKEYYVEAVFEDPTVIYKETPSKAGFSFVRYWMPKPCWAILKFHIEPAETGSGVTYESKIGVNDVLQKYQNEVEKTIPFALKQGIKGWEVTDLKITLVEGEDHNVHSRAGDFTIATPMGIMEGLKEIGTTFLEPYISYKITAPEEFLGSITSEIVQMRGTLESPEIEGEKFTLTGTLPVATSLDFPIKLSSLSKGKAIFSSQFHGYQKCEDKLGIEQEYRGISPLDTAKYILKARKALQ
ncbi:GTP-binding protein [Aureivirga sp. CE67]|uniref:GTP-binding protein n=1 Tax=Aureivirga sp. CE67 TaxID=1788983 RepID=UPI0018CBC2BC|nr:TetM/TetW/TetO/TetS family tetracycline resistance ribosomal protection protein [Aureivirga sp. CE67]